MPHQSHQHLIASVYCTTRISINASSYLWMFVLNSIMSAKIKPVKIASIYFGSSVSCEERLFSFLWNMLICSHMLLSKIIQFVKVWGLSYYNLCITILLETDRICTDCRRLSIMCDHFVIFHLSQTRLLKKNFNLSFVSVPD